MAITSEQIKVLREKSGAGMMDCKRALEEAGGDFDKAIEILRKKGAATAQKRADKLAKEGAIVTRISDDGKTGVVVEVNCETDFVARGADFINFANTVAEVIAKQKPSTTEQVMNLPAASGKTVAQMLNDLLAKIGEKIEVRRFTIYTTQNGLLGGYTHMGSKIGVLVELEGTVSNDGAVLSRDVAMQIAAMNPQYIRREEVSKEVVERELEIYRTQARNEKKPEQILDRIAAGRLEKFYQEVCLLEQTFIKDPSKTVKDMLGSKLTVRRFQRFHLGEN